MHQAGKTDLIGDLFQTYGILQQSLLQIYTNGNYITYVVNQSKTLGIKM